MGATVKNFDDWSRDLAKSLNFEVRPAKKVDDDKHEEDDFYFIEGCRAWPCRACDEIHEINCEPHEFDELNHYCGGSPRCCP